MTSDDRAKRLEQLPDWEWAASQDDRWNRRYEELLAYVAEHGEPPVVSSGPLGRWVADQRQAYKGQSKGKLTHERIQLLEQVPGWSWGATLDEQWSQSYEELVAYVADHERLPTASSGPLGKWALSQRQAYRGQGLGKITPERISLLEAVPSWWWTK